jgi:hypothetical protein
MRRGVDNFWAKKIIKIVEMKLAFRVGNFSHFIVDK